MQSRPYARALRSVVGALALLLPLSACTQSRRTQTFDAVWRTVDQEYYDPGFDGVDWRAVGERYRPLVLAAEDEEAFFDRLNEMLFELGVSHVGVGPVDRADEVGSAYVFAPGTSGIDLRILDGRVILSEVRRGSSAHEAGLRAGLELHAIDGRTVAEIQDRTTLRPPDNERHHRYLMTEELLRRIFGPAGSEVILTVSERNTDRRDVALQRRPRTAGRVLFEGLPEVWLECESRTLGGGIGYVCFNAFQPDVPRGVLEALEQLSRAPGLVVDLRGNNGGATDALRQIAGRLVTGTIANCVARGREDEQALSLGPTIERPYDGPLVLLVDEMSVSSAELFAACLQAAGRAKVVGARTPGSVLSGELHDLGHGVGLVVPTHVWILQDGTVLEGRGVLPDLVVALDPERLLEGVDSQLEAAVGLLLGPQGR